MDTLKTHNEWNPIPSKVLVPQSWDEVTVSQYQEIATLDAGSPSEKLINVTSILIDEDPELLRKIDLHALNQIISHLEWTNSLPTEANFKPIVKIDDVEYGFISRLTDLTTGEWIDLEHYLTNVNENLHKIFAVLYRPLVTAFNDRDRIIDLYDAITADVRANIFKEKGKVGDMYGAFVFFSLIVKESMQTIQDYLLSQMTIPQTMNLLKQNKNESQEYKPKNLRKKITDVGCGIVTYIFWPKEMSQKWKEYLKRTLSSPSTTKLLS